MSHSATDVLTRDEIRGFTRTSNLGGGVALAWTWLVIAGAFALVASWTNPLTFAIAVVLLGGRQLALAVAMHEAAHGTLFRTRALNELADWITARPVWADTARYRKHHLAHHAHTGTDRDPDLELAPVEPMSHRSLARKVARDLLGPTGVKRMIGLALIDAELLVYNVGGGIARAKRRGIRFHARALVANAWKSWVANAAIVGVLALAGCAWVYAAWIVAYLTTFSLFIRIRSLAEHACMERGDDPMRNTRTTRAGLLARATVAPLHVNYHLEHHLLPTVPWYRLPALGRLLAARDAIPPTSREASYIGVLRAVTHASKSGRT